MVEIIAQTRPAAEALVPPERCEPVTLQKYPTATDLRRSREWRFYPVELSGPNLERVAVHEAGHVVLMEWVGLTVHGATAAPTEGQCRFQHPGTGEEAGDDESGELAATAAAVFHAGLMAEMLLLGLPWTGPIFYPGQKDFQDADRMLRSPLGPHSSAGHSFAQQVALHVLSGHWPRVQEIADHLVAHGQWSPDMLA